MDQGGVYGGRDGRSPRKHLAPTCSVQESVQSRAHFLLWKNPGFCLGGPPSGRRVETALGGALAGAFDFCRTAKPASPDMECAFQ
jgi:hypothetical protein